MFGKKKTIQNAGMVDFRKYTPDALKKIKKIICAGMIILPEQPTDAFMEAFSDIDIICSGITIHLSENAEIKNINGEGLLTGNIDNHAIYNVNGRCIIHSVKNDAHPKVIVNGVAIYEESIDIDFIAVNGRAISVNKSMADNVTYSHDIEINSSVIGNYRNGIVVIAGHDLTLTSDITEEMLAEKELYFIAGHDIHCTKDIYGYIAANSAAGHQIKV